MTETIKKTLSIPIRISVSILLIGLLFHILHWPYSIYIISVSFCAISILYVFRFINKATKTSLDIVKLVLVISWSLHGIWTILHLAYITPIRLLAIISGIIWLIAEGFQYFRTDEPQDFGIKTKISNLIFILASILIILGVTFKIIHFPHATTLLIGGVACAIIWLIGDLFKS